MNDPAPSQDIDAVHDRARGALLGLAVGDAIGTTLEFKSRDSYPALTDMVGGGPFGLKPGQWTDDTAMTLVDSLDTDAGFDPDDLMQRFVAWRREGAYSCPGICFDIGITTSQALTRYERTGDAFAGSIETDTAGNASLMRLASVAIRNWRDPDKLRQVAIDQSRTTHGAPEALSACAAYASMLADGITGTGREVVLGLVPDGCAGAVAKIFLRLVAGQAARRHSLEWLCRPFS